MTEKLDLPRFHGRRVWGLMVSDVVCLSRAERGGGIGPLRSVPLSPPFGRPVTALAI